jgi:hypothetical protein
MARSKRTITRDSIFRQSGERPLSQGVDEPRTLTRQTAMWLSDDELEWLDSQCQTIRRSGWRGISRSAFVRALIQAAESRELDLSGVEGEAALAEALTRSLTSGSQAPTDRSDA